MTPLALKQSSKSGLAAFQKSDPSKTKDDSGESAAWRHLFRVTVVITPECMEIVKEQKEKQIESKFSNSSVS